jgi:putative DNA methylase
VSQARKKLIEVALPLEAINRESAREKSIRHGHPSTLHLWWARRPLAACRAVIFASIVDDPSSRPEEFPTEEDQKRERHRLFRIIEELVRWENSTNERVLEAARAEIRKATDGNPPPVLDPFCGGGSIPLEAQRLGLETHASDLNPVAVLITKALVEIPPKFAGRPPVNPDSREKLAYEATWKGAQGLAEDVRYYGRWMRDQAVKRIGHLYPKAKLPDGGYAMVIAWLWARTVKCPNPACGAQMPLARSFKLSTKKGKEVYVEPIVNPSVKTAEFSIRFGKAAPESLKVGRGAQFRCLICGQVADDNHIKAEGVARRMSSQLMAVVAEGTRGRFYLAPSQEQTAAAAANPPTRPIGNLADDPRNIWCVGYGLTTFTDLFTARQLVALTTLSELVAEAHEQILADGGDHAYSDAVATYLGLGMSKSADYNSSLVVWGRSRDQAQHTFARQALPMVWDFAEVNPFAGAAGDVEVSLSGIADTLERLPTGQSGRTKQLDATAAADGVTNPLVCTDPPYYDNMALR